MEDYYREEFSSTGSAGSQFDDSDVQKPYVSPAGPKSYWRAMEAEQPVQSNMPSMQPEMEPVQPRMRTPQSEMEPMQPRMRTPQPWMEPTQPEMPPTQPWMEPMQPQMPPTQPWMEPMQPEMEPMPPRMRAPQPEMEPIPPTQPWMEPEPSQPQMPPTQPWMEPMQPQMPPTQPWMEPMQPQMPPTQPWMEPMQPQMPSSQPQMPTSQPQPMPQTGMPQFQVPMSYYQAFGFPMTFMQEQENQRDMQRLAQLYPEVARSILELVEEECDKMEYEGSMMFDEMPDRMMFRMICSGIYDQLKDTMQVEEIEDKEEEMVMNQQVRRRYPPNQNWLGDLIQVLMLQEMYRRRCRHRNCRPWF